MLVLLRTGGLGDGIEELLRRAGECQLAARTLAVLWLWRLLRVRQPAKHHHRLVRRQRQLTAGMARKRGWVESYRLAQVAMGVAGRPEEALRAAAGRSG